MFFCVSINIGFDYAKYIGTAPVRNWSRPFVFPVELDGENMVHSLDQKAIDLGISNALGGYVPLPEYKEEMIRLVRDAQRRAEAHRNGPRDSSCTCGNCRELASFFGCPEQYCSGKNN